MASKNLTFDPNAGVPYAANLALYTGADFKTTFNVVDTSDVAYDFQGLTTTSVWTGSSQGGRRKFKSTFNVWRRLLLKGSSGAHRIRARARADA